MKKLVLTLLVLLLAVIPLNVTFAASNTTDIPAAKLVVNGKAAAIREKPVLVGNKLFLPVKTLALNIGIKNNSKSIMINNAAKTCSLVSGRNKLVLKLNNNKAAMNGKAITLGSAPTLYKKTVYLPADDVAKLFGKKVAWNSASGIIAICDKSSYSTVKDIMTKADKFMGSSKYKSTLTMNLKIGNAATTKMTSATEFDGPGMIQHDTNITNTNGVESYEEKYAADKFEYSRTQKDGAWSKTAAEEENSSILSTGRDSDETSFAGLAAKYVKGTNDIILEGDIELFASFDDVNKDSTYKAHTKIIIDKNTYAIKQFNSSSSGTTTISNKKYKYSNTYTDKFASQKSDFAISLPEEFSQLTETKKYKCEDLGVSINYPSTWGLNEDSSQFIAAFISPLENSSDKFAENVLLTVEDLSSQHMTLSEFTDQSLKQLKSVLTDFNLVSSEEAALDGIKAQKIVYTYKQGEFTLKGMYVWSVKDNIAYALCYTAETDKYDKYLDTAENIVKSFSIK